MRAGMRPWMQYLGVALLLGLTGLMVLSSSDQSLMAFEEGIYAQQARWMYTQGDWITVGWWGTPAFDHPIGLPWLIALSYHWFGQGEWTTRLPSLVASLGTVLLTWQIGCRLSAAGGFWGAAILTVMPLWVQASRLGVPYVVFTGCCMLALWALLKAEETPDQRRLWGSLIGLAVNASFLVAGTVVLLPVLALLPYLIRERHRHRHLTNQGLYWGLVLGAIPAMVWLSRSVVRHGWPSVQPLLKLPFSSLQETIVGSMAQPLLGSKTAFFYLWHLPLVTFPWIVLALIGTVLVWQNPLITRKTLWLGYPLTYFALVSLGHQHSDFMALPLYPWLAWLAGLGLNYLARLFCSPRRRHYRVAGGFGWGLGVLAILVLSAGGALVISPGELVAPEIKLLGWIALAVGTGWLAPWQMTVNRLALSQSNRVRPEMGTLWQVGWLLGPVLGIAILFLTGLWGNYSPDLKMALQSPPLAPVLESNPIHFIQPRQDQEDILLSFYTPQLGQRYANWQDVPPGEYAWGNSQQLPLPDDTYAVVGEVNGWQLVKAP